MDSKTGKTIGRDLFSVMMNIVEEDKTGMDGLEFEEAVSRRDIFPKQSIEVSKLVNMLNPEESEDKIVLACQDLLSIFRNHPVQKSIFVTQHGVMPLMEMLEQTNNLVRYSVLQVVNVLMKDNASLQVNACLVGFIPVIMNLAGPDHSKEMRMQAAYFVQQLCQTSSLTLQMFIACHGLPVLVGFLEHDYAKYREMVFLAIDCMWQVIRLQSCTPRNEFYWIFAKNGVLLRLVNALHSLNEATQLDSAAGSGLPVTVTDRMKQKAHSAPLEFSRPLSGHIETRRPQSSQLDPSKVQFGQTNLHSLSLGAQASSRKSTLQLQKCSVSKADAQYSLSQNGKIHSVAGKYKPDFFSNSSELASSESMCNSTGHQEWPALMPEDQLDRSKAQSDQTNLRSLSLGARASSRKSNLQLQRSFTNLVDAQYRLGQIGKIHSVAVNSEPAMFSNSSELASSESMSNSTEHHEPTDRNAEQLRQSHSNEKKYFMEINGHIDSSHAPGGLDNTLKSSFFRHGPVQPLLNVLEKEPPSRPVTGPLEYIRYLSGGLERPENIISLLHNSNSGIKTNGELNLLIAAFTENGREREAVELCSKSLPEGVASTSGLISQAASGLLSGSGILNAIPGSATSSCSLSQMALTLSADMAREYLEKVSDLLLEFSQASTTVKSFMCNLSLLIRLFQILNKLEPPILVKILKCTNRLSTDPNALENLQRADAMKHLIPFLKHCDGPLVSQIHVEVINTLYNLCKINKRRQEQAAENGIIPHLMHFISTDSPLKQVALPLLCDMAHASRSAREQLRIHDGLGVYLSLLNDEAWAVPALDSLAVCLAYDIERRKVEEAFFKKEAVQKLVIFFQHCSEQSFVHILEPFLKIITKSTRINTELATNGLTPLLIARLDHQDAIVRLNLLKLIKAIYEHHPRPKQLILENDLPFKLLKLIEERKNGERSGGQVLVKQMATSLLKALHINTVL